MFIVMTRLQNFFKAKCVIGCKAKYVIGQLKCFFFAVFTEK